MTQTRVSKQPPAPVPATEPGGVWIGVDAHSATHMVAVLDDRDQILGVREFPVTPSGYDQIIAWAAEFGPVLAAGVESTGSYAAGLTRALLQAGWLVLEVNTPDKQARARRGKTDLDDAVSAARAAREGRAQALPKITTGPVESIRVINLVRDSAVRSRTQAMNQLTSLLITAPAQLRVELEGLTGKKRMNACVGLLDTPATAAAMIDPQIAYRTVLKRLAQRILALTQEVDQATAALNKLTKAVVPTLRAANHVGPVTAAQLVVTAGQNIDRFARGERSVARLCGVAPIPASSGKTHRWRLSRHGDRAANSALYMIVIGRLGKHEPTRAYAARRTTEGKTKPETIRCLKRYLVREIVKALRTDLALLTT